MTGTAIAPAGLIAGRRMTKADKGALEYRIRQILAEHWPQSTRQIFYQALDRDGIASVDKSAAGYGRVQRAVLEMRRKGMIGWRYIVDGTRDTTYHGTAFDGLADFAETYRRRFALAELWSDKHQHVEIWTESRGFEASISALAERYRVHTVAFGGQPSDSLLFECADRLNDRDKQTLVLYCGDLDAAGLVIEERPREKLADQWGCEPDWVRVLVRPEQVTAYNLPTDEDGKAVQAEAFPLRQATALLESALQEFVTPDDLVTVEQREANLYRRLTTAAKWIDEHHGDPLS